MNKRENGSGINHWSLEELYHRNLYLKVSAILYHSMVTGARSHLPSDIFSSLKDSKFQNENGTGRRQMRIILV